LSASARSGRANPTDFLTRLLQSFVCCLGFPAIDTRMEMTPVDMAAEHIAALVCRQLTGAGRTYHITNIPANTIGMRKLGLALRRHQFSVDALPFALPMEGT
jgi:thioester reductase-like protein